MENEEAIDLRKLLGIMIERKKIVGSIVVGCTLIALIGSLLWPPTYESTTLVQTRNSGKVDISGAAAAMAALGVGGGTASPTMGYIELMKSRTVLEPIMENIDLTEEKKEKLTAKDFAKSNLDIKNTKGTNLIEVTAKGRSPEEAQMISQGIVDNFLLMMTNMNQQTQSLMVKFLTERTDTAKKDADEAAEILETFSKEHKIYGPDDQAKAAIAQIAAYDKAIGDMEVQAQGSQAQLDTVNAKISQQNINSKAYNISDNGNVQSLRGQIVAKEVELVGLQQVYQDKHPSVITARQELAQLQASLNQEVAAAVDAGTTTLNPVQSELLKSQALAQANLATTKASKAAIQKMQDQKTGDMSQFSDDVLDYMKLSRDSSIKNEIYLNLVKQCEQAKIQEAMEAMDIQVVDAADLPKLPSAPKKKLITAIGFVVGVLIAAGYSLMIYRKEA